MPFRAVLAALPLMLAAACASQNPSSSASATRPGETLTPETVAGGFRTAILDVCLTSLLNGTPVADLATETGPIEAAASGVMKAGPGDRLWEPRATKGSIAIRSNERECEVQAYGAPVAKTFEAVRLGLSDPHGFVLDSKNVQRAGVETHTKKVGDKLFTVRLSGTEPGSGAPSRLAAVVSAQPAA